MYQYQVSLQLQMKLFLLIKQKLQKLIMSNITQSYGHMMENLRRKSLHEFPGPVTIFLTLEVFLYVSIMESIYQNLLIMQVGKTITTGQKVMVLLVQCINSSGKGMQCKEIGTIMAKRFQMMCTKHITISIIQVPHGMVFLSR